MIAASKHRVGTKKRIKYDDKLMAFGAIAIFLFIIAILLMFFNSSSNVFSCSNKITANVKYNCYLNYALKNDNITVCNQLSSLYSSECMLAVAINYSDINYCKTIPNASIKFGCISSISLSENNPSYCNYLNGSMYDQCIYNSAKAVNFTNYSLCNELGNLSQKNTCLSVYYFRLTYKSGNNYCNYITNKPNYSILYNMVYFTNQSLISINNAYEYTYYNVTPYAYCISYVAYKSNNQNLCDILNNTNNTLCKNSFLTKINSNTSMTSLYSKVSAIPTRFTSHTV